MFLTNQFSCRRLRSHFYYFSHIYVYSLLNSLLGVITPPYWLLSETSATTDRVTDSVYDIKQNMIIC